MRLLGPKSYQDLLKIFGDENKFKDAWYPTAIKDSWPRDRFDEANLQFGEWNEYELSSIEILDVKLHWNKQFGVPEEGMTVAEALQMRAVQDWIARGGHKDLPNSHIWLAAKVLVNSSAPEYRLLKDHEGHLITLDGIHRLLAWASSGKEPVLAFIAGNFACD
jgi:hypothetical protein